MYWANFDSGAVAHGAEVGNHADVPEDQRDGGVGGDREDVPHQRGAELRPHVHGVGVRQHPVTQPGTADVDEREHAGADDGKNRHGFGETVDGVAPALLEQQQNGGDQRPGVADADPPDEVDDGEAPGYRLRDGPDAGAHQEQPGHRGQQQGGAARRPRQTGRTSPAACRGVSTMRAIFSVTDLKVCPGAMTRYSPVAGSSPATRCGSFGFRSVVAIVPLNPSPGVPPAGLQVPGSGSAPRPHTWSADAY